MCSTNSSFFLHSCRSTSLVVTPAYSCEYIANLLEQQRRGPLGPASAVHLTRRGDLLDLTLTAPGLHLYDTKATAER